LGHGPTKSSIELQSGLQVDVRVLAKKSWGAALQYFTGSQAHNIKVREIAREKGYSLNEEALRPIDEKGEMLDESHYVYCETEEEVYETIGLQWIPPEMREDSGEIDLAKKGELPKLITIEDMQADLHMHTTYSDGKLSIKEMANAALQRGMKYIVITDHSVSSFQAGGLTPEDALAQGTEVQKVNEEMGDAIQVLHGVELDIKADGTLDYEDEVLKQLKWVVASLHISLNQDKETTTARLLNAIKNPYVHCIGHPTARLISRRDPVKVDMDAVIAAAADYNTALEINANPERLDLDGQYARLAIDKGALISINTDAHSEKMMDYMPYGIMTARRGWVTAEQVINTWPYERFTEWLGNHQ
jgi:DNA polymerase (family 10)